MSELFSFRSTDIPKNKIFICGCPRSGTTALWRLLTKHPEVGIGVERYFHRVAPDKISISERHFDKKRFFSYQRGDTHFSNLTNGGAGRYYKELMKRYDNCKYVGDKIPVLYQNYEGILEKFPDAHIIFVFRNIYDVANSFIARYRDEDDDWEWNFDDAIKKWNESLKETIRFKKRGAKIYCVEYEELFFMNYNLRHLFSELDLSYSKELNIFYKNEKRMAKRLDSNRTMLLSMKQKKSILLKARFDWYRQLVTKKDTFK